jgi:tRNA 2-thiocytidine biosynthesis protein TtcA
MFRDQFTIIRPLAFVDEAMTEGFRAEAGIPELKNPCPSAGTTKRSELKEFLKNMYDLDPRIKPNVFRSLSRVKSEYMPKFT